MVGFAIIAAVGLIALRTDFFESAEPARNVTAEEAALLAEMRGANAGAGVVPVRMTLPSGDSPVTVDGYVDWETPLVYARYDDGDGPGLVQAIPGLSASAPDDEEAFAAGEAPEEGWKVRPMLPQEDLGLSPADKALDLVSSSVFTLGSPGEDDAVAFEGRSRWERTEVVDGVEVSVFRAPILVESGGADAPEAYYWVDEEGGLRRFEVNLGGDEMARVDFLLDKRTEVETVHPVDLLGGPRVDPKPAEGEMLETIAGVRAANAYSGAGLSLTVPQADGSLVTGGGFVDWAGATVYTTAVSEETGELKLLRPGGFAARAVDSDELRLPIPTDGWESVAVGDESAKDYFGTVESLLYRVLEMRADVPEDPAELEGEASVLREYEEDGESYTIVEYPVQGDVAAEAGESAFRYHLDAEGRLAAVEMMTAAGVARAEIDHGVDAPSLSVPWEVGRTIG